MQPFLADGSTNAWTYSTRRSAVALKDMYLRDILAGEQKLIWMTRELTSLKNNKAKSLEKIKRYRKTVSEGRCD
jgi:hypothetical protein